MATANCTARQEREDRTIARALRILEDRARYSYPHLDGPRTVRDYLRLQLANQEREEFWCLWLDAQHRVIESERLFVGTLTQTSVYPREVVKGAVRHNAAAVIFAHNHPSGVSEPSEADTTLTNTLKRALAFVDVTVLDHFIVGTDPVPFSFAERALL